MSTLRFLLNDRWVSAEGLPPTTTLLGFLRQRGLTGTKEGCAEGDCGACSVVLLDAEAPGGPRYRAINACLILLPMIQGQRVYTVEGLRDGDAYHPVQEALCEAMGSQCGYCTPGVVMAMFEACYRRDLAEPWQIDDQMCGNLCRCTGYRPIREATEAIAGTCPKGHFADHLRQASPSPHSRAFLHQAPASTYITPTTRGELWAAMIANPRARLICGGTDLSLTVTKRFEPLPALISLEGLDDLRGVTEVAGGWRIGATTLLADLEARRDDAFAPLHRMLRYFASRQIKNRATVGGNLCNASPIGDLAPVLIALGARAVIEGAAGERVIDLDQFFLGYRKTALTPGEILAAVELPRLRPDARASAYKVSKRRELDISAVAAGFRVIVVDGAVVELRAAYGGMAATPARARQFEDALRGQPWTREAVEAAIPALDRDFQPLDDHRGSAWFRRTVAKNLARGFFAEVADERLPNLPDRPSSTVHLEIRR
ncbi:MAG: xanthine dehydrogenase small subunit [Nannocystaceae bacterium]